MNDIISPAVTDVQCLEEIISCLEGNVPIKTQGQCDQHTIYEIMIKAASEADSIESTCGKLENAPSAKNIHYHLNKFQDIDELIEQINMALSDRTPRGLKSKRLKIAIDLNLIEYYGNPSEKEAPYIYRSQAKNGTNSFYAYASAYVIKKNKRVTLALIPVRRGETMVSVLTRLLELVTALGIGIKRLYLDRGFYNVPVIRWLQTLQIPFVMPVIIRGKKGGTRRLLHGKQSYGTVYTMNSQQYGSVSFDVWIYSSYRAGQYKKHGIKHFAYAVYQVPIRLRAIHGDYRLRFGIETSYRLKNLCRIRTTIKNPIVRLLFVAIAFLLVNLWVYILWHFVSRSRKGGRDIFRSRFPLRKMLSFLQHAIERHFGASYCVYLSP